MVRNSAGWRLITLAKASQNQLLNNLRSFAQNGGSDDLVCLPYPCKVKPQVTWFLFFTWKCLTEFSLIQLWNPAEWLLLAYKRTGLDNNLSHCLGFGVVSGRLIFLRRALGLASSENCKDMCGWDKHANNNIVHKSDQMKAEAEALHFLQGHPLSQSDCYCKT